MNNPYRRPDPPPPDPVEKKADQLIEERLPRRGHHFDSLSDLYSREMEERIWRMRRDAIILVLALIIVVLALIFSIVYPTR